MADRRACYVAQPRQIPTMLHHRHVVSLSQLREIAQRRTITRTLNHLRDDRQNAGLLACRQPARMLAWSRRLGH